MGTGAGPFFPRSPAIRWRCGAAGVRETWATEAHVVTFGGAVARRRQRLRGARGGRSLTPSHSLRTSALLCDQVPLRTPAEIPVLAAAAAGICSPSRPAATPPAASRRFPLGRSSSLPPAPRRSPEMSFPISSEMNQVCVWGRWGRGAPSRRLTLGASEPARPSGRAASPRGPGPPDSRAAMAAGRVGDRGRGGGTRSWFAQRVEARARAQARAAARGKGARGPSRRLSRLRPLGRRAAGPRGPFVPAPRCPLRPQSAGSAA